jgi:hypothetical protein
MVPRRPNLPDWHVGIAMDTHSPEMFQDATVSTQPVSFSTLVTLSRSGDASKLEKR